MLDISGQLCTRMCMITLDLVMHVKRIGGLVIQSLAKMVTSLPKEPFMRWGLDFVGPIKLA